MTDKTSADFQTLPGRLLLDTNVLDYLYEHGGFIWDGEPLPTTLGQRTVGELEALRKIFFVNEHAMFQFVVSPITIAEIANIQRFSAREGQLRWVLDVLDSWLVALDDTGDRVSRGGIVRHRFKLSPDLQEFEASLLEIPDFRRDPVDRLLLVQSRMAGCDAFLTADRNTIWRHRDRLAEIGVRILQPSDFWSLLEPWARLWT